MGGHAVHRHVSENKDLAELDQLYHHRSFRGSVKAWISQRACSRQEMREQPTTEVTDVGLSIMRCENINKHILINQAIVHFLSLLNIENNIFKKSLSYEEAEYAK